MPKVNKLQASFDSGEISRLVYGRTDNERYDKALALSLNYIPVIQGPLIRRPGTKFVGYSKDSTKPPILIPFQFSTTQNYMLEFGDRYVRFYRNEAQITTSSNSFLVSGTYGQPGRQALWPFSGIRSTPYPQSGEIILGTSLIAASAILELQTVYDYGDLARLKYTQKQDTLYITHPSYPVQKLIRTGVNTWDFKAVLLQDGPYLPYNTYLNYGDSANITLTAASTGNGIISTGSSTPIANIIGSSGLCHVITGSTAHQFSNGDRVCVLGVFGTVEANNLQSFVGNSTITNSAATAAYWTAINVTTGTFDLAGSNFQNAYVGSGIVYPALFQLTTTTSGTSWADIPVGSSQGLAGRNIALVVGGYKYWGHIWEVIDAAHATIQMGQAQNLPQGSALAVVWQLGVYNYLDGWPAACCFHQDRFMLAGPTNIPQEVDGSMSGLYEVFSANGSSLQVNNNNAIQFGLNSADENAIRWIKSNVQGLLVGTQSSEWTITPSTQAPALYPTNIKADQVTFYGSFDADAVQAGNAALYIQRAQRKVRELLYFWQVGSFRSTDLTELSEHLSLPSLIKLATVKETFPIVWGLRSDGGLISMSYSRDDITLRAGWAQHQLGGRSDSAGSAPQVKSIAVIPSSDTSFDELWMVTRRYMNGSTLACIEYMTKPFDDSVRQENAYHFDCGGTYDSPITVTAITTAPSCVVTAPSHGLTACSVVRFYSCIGINSSSTDINGILTTSSLLNEQTFVVGSVSTNAFKIQDFLGHDINTSLASAYVGSAVVRKLITSISGLGWLAGETVSVLADGGVHVNTSVTQAGVLNLSYPAAVVQVGYQYNSDAMMLRTKDGSAQGTSIGATRRVTRVAFMLHNVGDFNFGPAFTNLIPVEFAAGNVNFADTCVPLFDGIYRDGIESSYGFDDTVCFRQNTGLPGMIQAITRFLEEQDV